MRKHSPVSKVLIFQISFFVKVLAAQTRLAQELYRRPEFCDIYLVELLTLFADKGVAIQNVAMSSQRIKVGSHVSHQPANYS